MTLIINQIYIVDKIENSFQLALADSLLTDNGKFHSHRQKLFYIPYLNACVSYFGLAAYTQNNKTIFISDIINSFIKKNSQINTIRDFSFEFRAHLNIKIPIKILTSQRSGFHIAGYDSQSLPNFWHFSNISGMTGLNYNLPLSSYGEPSSDFLERDAQLHCKWNKETNYIEPHSGWLYRNGDIEIHVKISEIFDSLMLELINHPGYKKIKNHFDYADFALYKFKQILSIEKKWSDIPLIGGKVTAFLLTTSSNYFYKNGKWNLFT